MKTLKDNVAEILSKVPSLDGKFSVQLVVPNNKKFRIELRTEEGHETTFDMLNDLAETFSTKKINFVGDRSSGGCDSCDYGAQSYVEITLLEAII